MTRPEAAVSGLRDMRAGWRLRSLWLALANEDIGDQHRTTLLGPLWLLLNYLCFVGTFVFVFRDGFADSGNQVAYVAVGLLVWFYIMGVINQSLTLFKREQSFIKGTSLPLSVYVLRMTVQMLLRTSYSLIGCILIVLVSRDQIHIQSLFSLVSAAVIVLATPAIITVFAMLGTYMPDTQYLISNSMRLGMFLTPVIWRYDNSSGVRHILYHWNPFTYFVEAVRLPVVEGRIPTVPLAVCAAIGVCFWAAASVLLGRYRKRVVFAL